MSDQFAEWDRFYKTYELSKTTKLAFSRYRRWRRERELRKLKRHTTKRKKGRRSDTQARSRDEESSEMKT